MGGQLPLTEKRPSQRSLTMRLLSLAVVAGLFATGFGFADEPKKPVEGEKKAEKKAGKVTGVLSKVDGDKLVVTIKGDAGERAETFTTTDKTKFFVEEAAPAKDAPKEGDKPAEKKAEEAKPVEKKPEEKKPADEPKKEKKPAPKRTEIKLGDLKTGSRVAVTAGEDKVATEVVQLPAKPKKEPKKSDAPKEKDKAADKKPEVKK
jgi:hypothetical protein